MEITIDKKILEELEEGFFLNTVLSYESHLIDSLETSINVHFKKLYQAVESQVPIIDDDKEYNIEEDQQVFLDAYPFKDYLEVFNDFEYAINNKNRKIYFGSRCILNIFSKYLLKAESDLEITENDPVFDFMYYFYYPEAEEYRGSAMKIIINFASELNGFILYRDFGKVFKQINQEFLILPNDNHIPIRIAMLNSLNLISDLNNTVPNKEDIYRIIHAIVGGNEDNVKKYCLSLIGKNSLSQKQITQKHKEFAQKYINEMKL